ncbi:ABC-three component system protein [Bradyrhizobium sp.]
MKIEVDIFSNSACISLLSLQAANVSTTFTFASRYFTRFPRASPVITSEQRYWWRIALELKLRKCSGDAFQDFFSTIMASAHGSDFVRVRPFGVVGDKGCDGYLQSTGKVFACYGAINAASDKVQYLIKKMDEDFAKALKALASIMKEWHMVHNLVDGLPADAILKLEALKQANKAHVFGFIGMEGFEATILALPLVKIDGLLGIAATAQDAQNLQTTELRDLVAAIVQATDAQPIDVSTIRPVPPDKLDYNKLPGHWRSMIAGGWQNAHLVDQYLRQHHDTMIGERIAQRFRLRYQYFKAQNLDPGTIMSSLYEGITGIGLVPPARQVAAQALIAYLFESCDIFEVPPEKAAS